MRILGIDPGYATSGWAILERIPGGKLTINGTGGIKTTHGSVEQRMDEVCGRLRGIMQREAVGVDGLAMIAIEGYEYQGARTQGPAALFVPMIIGRLQEAARALGVQVVTLHRTSVLWSLTRSRKSDKAKVARVVLAFTGYRPQRPLSAHETDAAAVAIVGSMMRD